MSTNDWSMKKVAVFLICLAWGSPLLRCDDTAPRRWEQKKIASGDQGPSLDLEQDSLADLVILLHRSKSHEEILLNLGCSEEELARRLHRLSEAGFVTKEESGLFRPGIMVMEAEEVPIFMPVDGELVKRATDIIDAKLPSVKQQYGKLSCSRKVSFEDASLWVLSDVLLDNWQIRHVEKSLLGKPRPLRGGGQYYFALQEKASSDGTEAFRIYGNQVRACGQMTIGVYGNRRECNPANALALAPSNKPPLASLLRSYIDGDSHYASEFKDLGWVRNKKCQVPILHSSDLEILDGMADAIREDYLNLLKSSMPQLRQAYLDSPYAREVSFEEYYLWWYHLFYTAVTDRLVELGQIKIPATGITTYVLDPSL